MTHNFLKEVKEAIGYVDVQELNDRFVKDVLHDKGHVDEDGSIDGLTKDKDLDGIISDAEKVINTYESYRRWKDNGDNVDYTATTETKEIKENVSEDEKQQYDADTNTQYNVVDKNEGVTTTKYYCSDVYTKKSHGKYVITSEENKSEVTQTEYEYAKNDGYGYTESDGKSGFYVTAYDDRTPDPDYHYTTETKNTTTYDLNVTTTTAETGNVKIKYDEDDYNLAKKILDWANLLKDAAENKIKTLVYTLKDSKGKPAYINDYVDQSDETVTAHSSNNYDSAADNSWKTGGIVMPYNVMREYAQAMYEMKGLSVAQATSTSGRGNHSGEGASLTQTGENALVFYHYNTATQRIDGEAIYRLPAKDENGNQLTTKDDEGNEVLLYHYYRVDEDGQLVEVTPKLGDG
ncbi:MAG: hypothetical protein SPL94_10215 [Oribacterium sp.]|nr:hypothetical protein [Oribacterium sp.]